MLNRISTIVLYITVVFLSVQLVNQLYNDLTDVLILL